MMQKHVWNDAVEFSIPPIRAQEEDDQSTLTDAFPKQFCSVGWDLPSQVKRSRARLVALFSSQPLKVHPPSGGSQRGPPGARRTGESRGRHTQKNRPNLDLSATGSPPLPYLSARPPAWVSPPRFKLSDDPFKLTAGVKLPRRALCLPRPETLVCQQVVLPASHNLSPLRICTCNSQLFPV